MNFDYYTIYYIGIYNYGSNICFLIFIPTTSIILIQILNDNDEINIILIYLNS